MAEWLKAHAWKACLGETLTWVRIPLSPPYKSGLSAKNRPYPSELAELAAISNPARKRDRKTGLLYISSRRFPALFSEGQTGSPGFKTQTGECNTITETLTGLNALWGQEWPQSLLELLRGRLGWV